MTHLPCPSRAAIMRKLMIKQAVLDYLSDYTNTPDTTLMYKAIWIAEQIYAEPWISLPAQIQFLSDEWDLD